VGRHPGLIGSIVVSWIFQSRWVARPGLVAVTIVAAVGAASLIVAQRIFATRPGPSHG
jgi:uncharacterized membrane protein YeaQ/YmgE (transglycosylase-associated protein family)